MRNDIDKIVLSEDQIQQRLKDMAQEMESDFEDSAVFIGVLRGASVFVADLMRYISKSVALDYVQVGRRRNGDGGWDLDLIKDISTDVGGETVYILEDTVDTGTTLKYLKELLLSRGAADVRICILMDKSQRVEEESAADYVGFRVTDLEGQWNYVVGYGIDFNERYRNLPYVGVLKKELWAPLEI